MISIFAFLVFALGVCILISGKWIFYPIEDDSSINIVLSGRAARLIGLLLVLSSALLFAGIYYGFAVLVLAALLPNFIHKSNSN